MDDRRRGKTQRDERETTEKSRQTTSAFHDSLQFRSLTSKVDKLQCNTRVQHEYRDSACLWSPRRGYKMYWLVVLEGFSLVCSDRNANLSKIKGGDTCVFVLLSIHHKGYKSQTILSPMNSGIYYNVLFISRRVEMMQRKP